MVDVDKAVLARYKSHGSTFEVLVDCDKALAFREGQDIPLAEILAAVKIYDDAKKGLESSESALNNAFSTTNPEDIAKTIIQKGEIQLTAEYRAKLRDQKRKRILNLIHRNGVDPKTHAPHPLTRLENAFEEAKVHIDEFESVERQIKNILVKLRPILPIKFEIKEVELKLGPQYAAKAYSSVKKYGTILSEQWRNDGYWQGVVEIPGGMEQELYDALNAVCHGEVESRVLKTK